MFAPCVPLVNAKLTGYRSSVKTTDAVYDSQSHQGAPVLASRYSSSGHQKSSKSSGKAKDKSGKRDNSKRIEAEKKQRQEEDLMGVGSQFD